MIKISKIDDLGVTKAFVAGYKLMIGGYNEVHTNSAKLSGIMCPQCAVGDTLTIPNKTTVF